MVDVNRRQFLVGTVVALTGMAFSETALGADAVFEQRGSRGNVGECGWDEMHEEMRCWVGGIKDYHDLVIDHVKEMCRSRILAAQASKPVSSDEELQQRVETWASDEQVEKTCRHQELVAKLAAEYPELGFAPMTEAEVRTMLETTTPTVEELRQAEEDRRSSLKQQRLVKRKFLHAEEDAGCLYLDEVGDLCVA